MPRLLYRSILVELLRTTLLTTTVLVTVIAFGAAVPPLTQNLLGPRELGLFLVLASVPMLQYALPFAAAFATTTVYHRLSADREVQAMAAAGLSLRRILTPVLLFGAALLLAMLLLVHLVAPIFWGSMQALLGRDAARLLVASVEQGRAIRVGPVEIYADEAYIHPDRPPTGARQRLILSGVAAIEIGGAERRPITEFTAEHAVVDVHEGESGAILKLALVNATVQRESEMAVAVLPQAMPEAIELGGRLSAGPKALTYPQLHEARAEPHRFPQVRPAAETLAQLLRQDALWERLGERLDTEGEVWFEVGPDRERLRVAGGRIRTGVLAPREGASIRVSQWRGDTLLREARSEAFELRLDPTSARGDEDRFELVAPAGLEALLHRGGRTQTGRWPQRIGELRFTDPPSAPSLEAAPLLAEAGRYGARPLDAAPPRRTLSRQVDRAASRLAQAVDRFQLDITARFNQRLAQALTAILMPLLAGVLAVRGREGSVLWIFLLVFLPSLAAMLCISSGEQMTRWDRPVEGLALMWGGEAALALLVAGLWWRAARN